MFYRSSSNVYCPAATVVKLLYHNTPGAVNAKKFAAWRDADSSSFASLQSTLTTHQSFVHSTPSKPSLQDQLSITEEMNNYVGQRTDDVSECESNALEESEAVGFADREPAQTPRIKISTYPKAFRHYSVTPIHCICCRHFAHRLILCGKKVEYGLASRQEGRSQCHRHR